VRIREPAWTSQLTLPPELVEPELLLISKLMRPPEPAPMPDSAMSVELVLIPKPVLFLGLVLVRERVLFLGSVLVRERVLFLGSVLVRERVLSLGSALVPERVLLLGLAGPAASVLRLEPALCLGPELVLDPGVVTEPVVDPAAVWRPAVWWVVALGMGWPGWRSGWPRSGARFRRGLRRLGVGSWFGPPFRWG
jgi:hypothetical protein